MKYINKSFKSITIFISVLLLAACGSTPQPTVALQTNVLAKDDLKVGFVFTEPKEKATTHIFGASCLLCYGVASTLTNKLDNHLEQSISNDELIKIKDLVLSEYAKQNDKIELVTLSTPINKLKKFKGDLGFAKKDFRALKEELNIDLLVVLDIERHGAFRSFSGYIPNGDPQGHIAGLLYAVDLNSNAYVQFLRLNETVQPNGEWDDGPSYPSVTTSYYQAVENVKEKLLDAI